MPRPAQRSPGPPRAEPAPSVPEAPGGSSPAAPAPRGSCCSARGAQSPLSPLILPHREEEGVPGSGKLGMTPLWAPTSPQGFSLWAHATGTNLPPVSWAVRRKAEDALRRSPATGTAPQLPTAAFHGNLGWEASPQGAQCSPLLGTGSGTILLVPSV